MATKKFETIESVRVYEIFLDKGNDSPYIGDIFTLSSARIAKKLCDLLNKDPNKYLTFSNKFFEHGAKRFDFREVLVPLTHIDKYHFKTLVEAINEFQFQTSSSSYLVPSDSLDGYEPDNHSQPETVPVVTMQNEEKSDSVIALMAGNGEYGGGRGDGVAAYQPLFVYSPSNQTIHDFVKTVIASFDEYRMIALAEHNQNNATLMSGFPKVVSQNINDIIAAVTATHSKELAKNLLERYNDLSHGIQSGDIDPPDEPDLVQYPGSYYH